MPSVRESIRLIPHYDSRVLQFFSKNGGVLIFCFRIIEVGSWKGMSTAEMGKACKTFTNTTGKKCYIISIDTWLGSAEHYESLLLDMETNEYAIK